METHEAQTALDDINTRRRETLEQVARQYLPWWFAAVVAAAMIGTGVASNVDVPTPIGPLGLTGILWVLVALAIWGKDSWGRVKVEPHYTMRSRLVYVVHAGTSMGVAIAADFALDAAKVSHASVIAWGLGAVLFLALTPLARKGFRATLRPKI